MTKKIAIYPGTFDPITNGHLDIISRAANLFDEVVVGIATSKRKQPYLDLDLRLKLTKEVLKEFSNVKVAPINALLVDFAKAHHATIILRGLRAVSDFDYEFQMALTNRKMAPNIETIFLMTDYKYSYLSSSFVKHIAALGGDVSELVPAPIAKKLKKRGN